MEGIIVSIKYGVYVVNVDGVLYNTSPRGLLKFKDKLYVGDKVLLDDSSFLILEVFNQRQDKENGFFVFFFLYRKWVFLRFF